jgi:hypothetical protein
MRLQRKRKNPVLKTPKPEKDPRKTTSRASDSV